MLGIVHREMSHSDKTLMSQPYGAKLTVQYCMYTIYGCNRNFDLLFKYREKEEDENIEKSRYRMGWEY